jgi:hypothetical protein
MPRKNRTRRTKLRSDDYLDNLYLLPPAELRSGLLGDGRYRFVPQSSRTNG